MNTSNDVAVFLQLQGEHLHPISRELAMAAQSLVQAHGFRAYGICLTAAWNDRLRQELQEVGLHGIAVYQHPDFRSFDAQQYRQAVQHALQKRLPGTFLVGATLEGRALAPLVAAHFQTGVTADCTQLSLSPEGELTQTRPAFGGNVMAQIVTPQARPQIATVRYGVLQVPPVNQNQTEFEFPDFAPTYRALQIKTRLTAQDGAQDDPRRVLAIGGALRAQEDIASIQTLCAQYDMVLRCSRSLVERGWMSQNLQIGLSGHSIQPDLLLTMGISGSVQFLAGVQQAKRIVAVNTDAQAPIMRVAQLPLIADLYALLPLLLK